jgi:hypothetical protein
VCGNTVAVEPHNVSLRVDAFGFGRYAVRIIDGDVHALALQESVDVKAAIDVHTDDETWVVDAEGTCAVHTIGIGSAAKLRDRSDTTSVVASSIRTLTETANSPKLSAITPASLKSGGINGTMRMRPALTSRHSNAKSSPPPFDPKQNTPGA